MTPTRWRQAARGSAAIALGVACAALSSGFGAAASLRRHELAETSATVVVRDGGYVQLRLQVPWADVLRARWSPAEPMRDFLMRITAQRPEEFARALARLEAGVERDAVVLADTGDGVAFVRWQWPSPATVQEALRRELMSRLAEPASFEHASRLPAVAERTLRRTPASIRLRLPALLGPVLLTVYRPTERWLEPGATSPSVRVGAR